MRLLHTKELRFEEFFDNSLPPYAILSHRWLQGEEVSYQEFLYLNRQVWAGGQVLAPLMVIDDSKQNSTGFQKVMEFRRMAATMYDWCWVDTVCIDKSSSAELSEAINSMYEWYARSDMCYVYLADVNASTSVDSDRPSSFKQSEWFRRGWTLQELVAPKEVAFFDQTWTFIGDKVTLQHQLANITSIPLKYFADAHRHRVKGLRASEKMVLALGRQTSRREDRAYSLLGLFDVNIPLLYGEGDRAFRRLQREILQAGAGSSLLAHTGSQCLADSIEDFAMHTSPIRLARRQSKISLGEKHSGDLITVRHGRIVTQTGRGPTWVRSISGAFIEVEALFLELPKLTFGDGARIFRLIALSSPSENDLARPVFLLVRKVHHAGSRWRKCGLVDGNKLTFVGGYDHGTDRVAWLETQIQAKLKSRKRWARELQSETMLLI